MSDATLSLFDEPGWLTNPSTRLEREFAVFHASNPHVYEEFERRALEFDDGARYVTSRYGLRKAGP
jgi:hypothetical protein